MVKLRSSLIAAWLVCQTSLCAFAKSPPDRYAVDVWTTKNGLPQNSVLALTQTRDGYLWLGTLNGLARFDGTRFVLFDESNTPELNSGRIVRIFEDSQTNLWIATEAGSIVLATGGKMTKASVSPGRESAASRLMAITEDHLGGVWLYTADGQLGHYVKGQMDVADAGLGVASQVRALAADNSGLLWVGVSNLVVGVGPLPVPSAKFPMLHAIPMAKVDYLLTSTRGGFWRLANGRIQKCSGTRVERDLGRYPWGQELLVSAACEDLEGNLIVGTYGDPGEGVFWFGEDGKPTRLQGLSHSSILSLAMDREGSLWVGTDGGGLNRIRRQVFETLEGSQGATVQSVSADPHGGLWIGYNWDRVDYWGEEGSRQFQIRKPGALLAVRSVYMDRSTNVWVGAYGGGLFQLSDRGFEPVTGFDLVANPHVSAVFERRDGTIWAGTQGGLCYSQGDAWRTFSTREGLSANAVQAIAEDRAGNLWVGTAGGGLNRIGKNGVAVFTRTNGLPSNDVSALFIDESGVLWAGTSAGLARMEGERWTSFTTQQGLSGNSIRYILEDKRGFLWVGSNAGLMRMSKDALKAFANEKTNAVFVRTVFVRTYGEADGVPTSESSQGSQPGAARTPEGKMWFATIKGLAGIDPAQLIVNSNPPPVVIEAILVDGQRQGSASLRAPVPRHITVPAQREAIEIQFASLNLSTPERARYRYRLGNHESGWTHGMGNRGVSHHTRVPAGDYTFQVQAANEDDVWNEEGATVAFTVLPPFWQTWWFISLSSLCGLGLITGVVHYISTQKLQRQLAVLRQQEALERERARIARDLHDQLGANLTQVALLGELAEADKDLPQEVESHARQISATARETTRSLDEIVWTVNPANDTLDGLINYICKYAQEYFALAGLSYRLEVPPSLPPNPISPEVRHNVFLAAKEAVNNVVKHAKARSAWLRLNIEPHRFTLEIQDDGQGLSPEAEKKGRNGLRNMSVRMQDVGGFFDLSPRPAGGTIVRLTAPLKPISQTRQPGPS